MAECTLFDEELERASEVLPADLQQNIVGNLKWWKENKSKLLSILVTGRSGAGKSTLVNAILGVAKDDKNAAREGRTMRRCTTEVKSYGVIKNGVKVTVWDSPGLLDRTGQLEEYIQQMKENCSNVDLIMYCIKLTDTRFVQGSNNPDVVAMRKITDAFGQNFWRKAVIVLTYANVLDSMNPKWEDLSDDKRAKAFNDKIKEWEDQIKVILLKDIDVPNEIVNDIKTIPAGHVLLPHLLGVEYWLSNLWLQCLYRITSPDTQCALLQINLKRFEESTADSWQCITMADAYDDQKEKLYEDLEKVAKNLPPELAPDLQKKVVENLKKWKERDNKSLSILLTGKTGAGKSTLINGILGVRRDDKNDAGEGDSISTPCTKEVTAYFQEKNFVDVTLWDSPGLQDGTDDQEYYLQQIKEKCPNIDLVMYCIKLTDARFVRGSDNPDVVAMRKITDAFGHMFWQKTVIVLTYANVLESMNPEWEDLLVEKRAKAFNEKIKEWEDQIKVILLKDINISNEIVDNLRIVPAGYERKPHLPGVEYWLSNLWFQCFDSITSPDTRCAMLQINLERFKKVILVKKEDFEKVAEDQPIVVSNNAMRNVVGLVGLAAGSPFVVPVGALVGMGVGFGGTTTGWIPMDEAIDKVKGYLPSMRLW